MGEALTHSGRSYVLERPVLELTVLEVRHQPSRASIALEDGFAIRDQIQGSLDDAARWRVEPAQSQSVTVDMGPSGILGQHHASEGVRLSDQERGLDINIFPTATSLQVKSYRRWSESFKPLIDAVLHSVENVLAPLSRDRLGLRYVNRFVDEAAQSPRFWGELLEPALVGALQGPTFADQVVGAQHQLELQLDIRTLATLRHGLLRGDRPESPYDYLLDIDVYTASTERFSAAETVDLAEHLNRCAAELFSRSLGAELAGMLGKHDVPPPQEVTAP